MRIRDLGRWIVLALILAVAAFYSPQVGTLLVVGYIAYVLWSRRSAILSRIAVRKYQRGDTDGALSWYAKAAAAPKAAPAVHLSYALILLKSGDLDSVEKSLSQAAELELSEYDRNVLSAMRGLLAWKQGHPQKAAAELRALADEFQNTTLLGALGSLYLSEGMLDAALRHNLEAKEISPYDRIIGDNLARTYYLNGDIEKAEEIFDDLIDRSVRIPEPYINKALIQESRGNIVEAYNLVKQASQHSNSFLSYFSQEEIDEIVERIETIVEQ